MFGRRSPGRSLIASFAATAIAAEAPRDTPLSGTRSGWMGRGSTSRCRRPFSGCATVAPSSCRRAVSKIAAGCHVPSPPVSRRAIFQQLSGKCAPLSLRFISSRRGAFGSKLGSVGVMPALWSEAARRRGTPRPCCRDDHGSHPSARRRGFGGLALDLLIA
jgi:hypothetical protein